jgi:hypothetical protein
MNERVFAAVAAGVLGMVCVATPGFSDTRVPTEGPGAKPGWPGWYLMGSPTDPEGPVPLSQLTGRGELGTSSYGRAILGTAGRGGGAGRGAGATADGGRGANLNPPGCRKSVICEMDGTILGGVSDGIERVVWKQTIGYTFAYPFDVPKENGNVSGVAADSRDNLWVYQRAPADKPALYKFGPDHKLLFSVPPELTNHSQPFRGHGMNVDADDNVWICNEGGAVVEKFSPEGRLLQTIGTKGHRGDWDEARGQRLLWEPVHIDLGPNGDIYIFESHGDESPNDVGSDAPTNIIGAARVIHLDKNGKFINQWFGNDHGPGKFYNAHGGAVDPVTGDVWVGDRQDYRIVIFNANGHFLRTLSMRNLTSILFFEKHRGPNFGQLWMASGQDAQILKLDRDGNVLGAIGSRKEGADAPGHFMEASYMSTDTKGNLYVGDTLAPRVTELIPPAKAAPRK